jgi:hypothetical protein
VRPDRQKLEELAGIAMYLHASASETTIRAKALLDQINEMANGKDNENGRNTKSIGREEDVSNRHCDGSAGGTPGT